jgi:acyl dehydratase
MGKESTKIRFQDEHIPIFSALSFDTNPVHFDPDYSRATPYGEPVVFGMAATLSALSHCSEGKAFPLGMIRGVFLTPIFRLVEYERQLQEKRNE